MKYRTRTFYTETEKALMWERWREGESLHAIAQSGAPNTGSRVPATWVSSHAPAS
jgi:hypothetical protein